MFWSFIQNRTVSIILLISTAILGFFTFHLSATKPKVIEKFSYQNSCSIDYYRGKEYQFTKPLLMVDVQDEDAAFFSLKTSIENYIKVQMTAGNLHAASVYFRDYNKSKSFSINPEEKYNPASIMKLLTLISYLAKSEINPEKLNEKFFFEKHFESAPTQIISGPGLKPGTYYTVRELLFTMIVHSDNDATALLNNHIDFDYYKTVLRDLRLPIPSPAQPDYPINVVECSRFLRALYNASFLSPYMSETALSMLVQNDYKSGISRYLDPSVKVASKFGERNIGNDQQLSETGIVYLNDHPYLLTVMTKGSDHSKLPEVLAAISKMVFDQVKSMPSASTLADVQ